MFKGLGGLGDMGKMLAKAQELQAKMGDVTNELEGMTVEGESGAGLVKVTANGKGDIQSINIDPSLLSADEKGVLEDLVVSAVQSARDKAQNMSQQHMQKISEDLGIPLGAMTGGAGGLGL